MTKLMKTYGINVSIESAEGYQQFEVIAEDKHDALRKFKSGETTGNILFNEVEVQGLNTESVCIDDIEEAEPYREPLSTHALTEQNKETVDNFQILIYEMKQELVKGSYAVDTESGSSMVISIPAVNGEISKITRALVDNDYMNSIIAKHKGQYND